MADEHDIIETTLLYLPVEERETYRSLVTSLLRRVVRTVSAYHTWDWRNTYKDLTHDATNPVHTLPADCHSIDQDGAALLDSDGNPSGKPLVYMSERQYHELRGTTSSPSDERYYVSLKKLTAEGLTQVRFWPNITMTTRLWYWRTITSADIANIEDEVILMAGIVHLLPSRIVPDAARFEKEFYNRLALEKRNDRKARAEKISVRQHPLTSKHNRFMRQIQS